MNVLETSRLKIRPFTEDDLTAAHQVIFLDIKWLGRQNTIAHCRSWLQSQEALRQWRATGGYYGDRAIILKQTGALIGMCGFRSWMCSREERGLYDTDRMDRELEGKCLELGIGYAIGSAYRRQGYATEAITGLIKYGFEVLQVRRIVALTGRGNEPSVKVMRSAGMTVGLNPDRSVGHPWGVGMIENPAFAE